jgi:hypothetical protein
MNARTAEAAGINRFKILVIINIDMWHHPKYYKELRKARNELAKRDAVKENREAYSGSSLARNKSDQAISKEPATAGNQRSPGSGLKQQGSGSSNKQQAEEAQATETQASSSKR